jgi:hypothetical protein
MAVAGRRKPRKSGDERSSRSDLVTGRTAEKLPTGDPLS